MAVYDSLPPYIKPDKKVKPKGAIAPDWPKKGSKKRPLRSQRPGHPADDQHMLAEPPKVGIAKKAAPVSKRQRAAESKGLDKTNKPTKVAGKSGTRDSLAQGARKAGTPTPKPNENDKKVRGQSKK